MDEVEQVRRFNRLITQRVGALDEEYLGRGRPLGASRVLWEVPPDGVDVRELRARLGLDSGYLSRLLGRLADENLVASSPDKTDNRVRRVRLTSKGRREHAALDAGSDALARSLLAPLSDKQRERLVAAMAEVELLLTAGLAELRVVDPADPVVQECWQAYFATLAERFDAGFDPEASRQVGLDEVRTPRGATVVAFLHGRPVGCGSVKHHGEWAEVKRVWVSPDARGLGLARRLMTDLEERARAAGASAVRLDTNRTLVEAIGLYDALGYRQVPAYNDEPYAHFWLEKQLRPSGSGRARR